MNFDAEELEARICRKMASHAAITARGYDTIRQRNVIHAEIDALLDQLASTS